MMMVADFMLHEEQEDTIRLAGRKAYIYHWSDEQYRRRRQSLAHAHHTSIEEVQILCGEGWREALAEEQEEGLPLLYLRELVARLDPFGEEDLVWLVETVIESLETSSPQ